MQTVSGPRLLAAGARGMKIERQDAGFHTVSWGGVLLHAPLESSYGRRCWRVLLEPGSTADMAPTLPRSTVDPGTAAKAAASFGAPRTLDRRAGGKCGTPGVPWVDPTLAGLTGGMAKMPARAHP